MAAAIKTFIHPVEGDAHARNTLLPLLHSLNCVDVVGSPQSARVIVVLLGNGIAAPGQALVDFAGAADGKFRLIGVRISDTVTLSSALQALLSALVPMTVEALRRAICLDERIWDECSGGGWPPAAHRCGEQDQDDE